MAKKNKVVIVRMSEQDEAELEQLSKNINRSKSGALRYALREVARAVREHPDKIKLIRTVRAS